MKDTSTGKQGCHKTGTQSISDEANTELQYLKKNTLPDERTRQAQPKADELRNVGASRCARHLAALTTERAVGLAGGRVQPSQRISMEVGEQTDRLRDGHGND
ncbi:unnamed protein product [Laminaria digitata]